MIPVGKAKCFNKLFSVGLDLLLAMQNFVFANMVGCMRVEADMVAGMTACINAATVDYFLELLPAEQ